MAGVTAFSLSEVEEGSEPDEFWKAIGGKRFYCSLAHGKFQDSSANIKVKAATDRIKRPFIHSVYNTNSASTAQ